MAVGTVLFMDGADTYKTADILKRWTSWANQPTVGIAYARGGLGQGILIGNGSAAGGNLVKDLPANYTGGLVCFGWDFGTGSLASKTLLVVRDGGTEQISIRTDASSRVIVTRNGTQIGTTGPVLTASTYNYFELLFTIHVSTGAVDLHMNGASVAAGTNLNTRNTANTQWTGVGFSNASGTDCRIDDIMVIDTSTGTDYPGPMHIGPSRPAAPGNYAQWGNNGGNNFGCVSDDYEDGDTSFIQSATANQIDSYLFQDLPFDAGTIIAVQDLIWVRQDAGAQRTVASLLRSGTTDYVGATINPTPTYQCLAVIRQTDPDTAAAYSIAGFNAQERGVKLTA